MDLARLNTYGAAFLYRSPEGEGAGSGGEGEGKDKPAGQGDGSAEGKGSGEAAAAGSGEGEGESDGKSGKGSAKPGDEGGDNAGWKDRRIGELTATRRQAEQRAAELQQQLEAANRALADARAGKMDGLIPKDEAVRMAKEQAVALAAQMRFNEQCEATVANGRREFEDFDGRLNALRQVGGLDPNNPKWTNFVTAALETGEAHRILHELGGNLDEASRILDMTPLKMVAAMTKLTAGEGGKGAGTGSGVTRAPKPFKPLKGAAAKEPSLEDDNLSTADWIKLREKDVIAKRKEGMTIQ